MDPLLLDLPVSIETARLLVRVPQAGDGLALNLAVVESLRELRQFLGFLPWIAGDPTPNLSEARCRSGAANFLSRTDLPFLVFEKSSGQLLGGVGLHRTVWSTPKTEVGYWIRSSRTGSGFATEAVSALVEYAFNQMQAVRIELITDEANAPSRQIAERCQFDLEGILRNEQRALDGSLHNTCVYSILPQAT